MSSVNATDPFHKYFNVEMEGASIGAVFALYSVGASGPINATAPNPVTNRDFGNAANLHKPPACYLLNRNAVWAEDREPVPGLGAS